MNTETPTPETDKWTGLRYSSCDLIATSRRLERERNELSNEVVRLSEWTSVNGLDGLIREIEELREQYAKLQAT
jgi:hypothetical protein